jgi:hypothetical protein
MEWQNLTAPTRTAGTSLSHERRALEAAGEQGDSGRDGQQAPLVGLRPVSQRAARRPGTLSVDGKAVDSHAMPRSLPITIGWTDVFHVGTDVGTPVDDADFQSPFPFTGKLEKLTIKVGPEQLTPEDRELLGRTTRDFD